MKTCKIKPPVGACIACFDIDYDENEPRVHCSTCSYNTKRYELLEVKSGLINDYAFIQSDGKIQKVSLDRVYDVKESESNV